MLELSRKAATKINPLLQWILLSLILSMSLLYYLFPAIAKIIALQQFTLLFLLFLVVGLRASDRQIVNLESTALFVMYAATVLWVSSILIGMIYVGSRWAVSLSCGQATLVFDKTFFVVYGSSEKSVASFGCASQMIRTHYDSGGYRDIFGLFLPVIDFDAGVLRIPILIFVFFPIPLGVVPRVIRNRDRRRSGLCRICDFDLRGNSSGICPECGTPIPEKQKQAIVEASNA